MKHKGMVEPQSSSSSSSSSASSSQKTCDFVALILTHVPLPAFSLHTLTSNRWLLGQSCVGADAHWHDILLVDPQKQMLFMERILFLHERAYKRSSRAVVPRLALTDWCAEADKMCLAAHVIREMCRTLDQHGNRLFDTDVLKKVTKRTLDGQCRHVFSSF